MSLKKFANWTGDVVGEFTGAAGEERAAKRGEKRSLEAQQKAEALTKERLAATQPWQNQIQSLVMGGTPIESIPGYNAMSNARREGISDMTTGMGGAGLFFSGATAEQAADISGGMENNLIQQHLQNLRMGLGGEQDITNMMMGGNQVSSGYGNQASQFDMAGAGARADSMSDMLGAVGTFMGGAGGVKNIASGIKGAAGGAMDWMQGMGNSWSPKPAGYQMSGAYNRGF